MQKILMILVIIFSFEKVQAEATFNFNIQTTKYTNCEIELIITDNRVYTSKEIFEYYKSAKSDGLDMVSYDGGKVVVFQKQIDSDGCDKIVIKTTIDDEQEKRNYNSLEFNDEFNKAEKVCDVGVYHYRLENNEIVESEKEGYYKMTPETLNKFKENAKNQGFEYSMTKINDEGIPVFYAAKIISDKETIIVAYLIKGDAKLCK